VENYSDSQDLFQLSRHFCTHLKKKLAKLVMLKKTSQFNVPHKKKKNNFFGGSLNPSSLEWLVCWQKKYTRIFWYHNSLASPTFHEILKHFEQKEATIRKREGHFH
jgi:hypothetical protein